MSQTDDQGATRRGEPFPPNDVDEDEQPARPPAKRRRAADILLLLLALLLLAGGLLAGFIALRDNRENQAAYASASRAGMIDLQGNIVTPEDTQVLDPSYSQAADETPEITPTPGAPGLRFKIASLGMDVSLGAVNEVDNTLNPPGFRSAYLVRNVGAGSLANADQGTVIVVMHSVRAPGFGPGNYLINFNEQTVSLAPGALIQVGDRTYQYTRFAMINKADLAATDEIWDNTPGELILITCMLNLQHTLSDLNVVVFATLVS